MKKYITLFSGWKEQMKGSIIKNFSVLIIFLCLFTIPVMAETLLLQESFEGDATNYDANTFYDGANDYFRDFNVLTPPSGWSTSLTSVHGNKCFLGEDVDSTDNPLGLGEAGYIVIASQNVSAYTNVRVKLLLANNGANCFEESDGFDIQYAFDGDIATSGDNNVNTGTYTTVGSFRSDQSELMMEGHIKEDTDFNDIGDGILIGSDFKEFTYDFATNGATNASIRIKLLCGGYEELAVDNIRIYGFASNTAPTAIAPSAPTVAENDTNIPLSDDIQVVDADGDHQTVTFTITGGTLNIGTSGITFSGNGNSSSTFTASGTLFNINAALDAATFTPTPNLSGTNAATISFTTNDGTESSNVASVSFDITSTDDEPTLTVTGTNPTFTEGGSAVTMFSGASASTVESGQTLSDFTMTVTNVTDGSNERINLDGTSIVLTHGTSGTTATNSLSYSVSVSGTTATLSLSGGTLSPSAFEALINAISYQNNSNMPSTLNRIVTITSLTDSGSNTGSNDNFAALSIASTVTVTSVNDEPYLTATGSNPTFTEGGSAVTLFSGASASTVESGQTLSAFTMTVANVNNGSNERINLDGTTIILTHGTCGTTATNSLSYSVSVSGTTATLSLSGGTLSPSAFEALINAISYQNNSNMPNTLNRIVTITSLTDSGSNTGSNDNTTALSISSTVTVTSVNDKPILTSFADVVETTNQNAEIEITLAELKAMGDEADVDGTVDAFIVKSLSTGTLNIGVNSGEATAFNETTNNTINATNNAYWTPDNDVYGTKNAFTTTVLDNDSAESTGAVQATVMVNAIPTVAFNATSSNGSEALASADLQVDLSAASGFSVIVPYTVTGTASGSGTDYTLANGTLTIGAGDVNANITIASIVNDLLDENDETVIVTLSTPMNAIMGTNTVHTYTINDNDATPTIATNTGLTLNEGATKSITLTELSADDADTVNATLTYIVSAVPSNGQLENADNSGTSISSFTQQNLIDGKIEYVHDGSNTTSDSFTFKVSDGTNELTGQTFSITINPVDDDAPIIVTLLPENNTVDVDVNANLQISFNETVVKGTGNIYIKKTADTSVVETLDVTSEAVTINNNLVAINTVSKLEGATQYYVQIDATAFADTESNPFIGIANTTSWTFTTAPSNNANLSAISLSNGTLSPNFDVSTTSYNVNVSNGVSKVMVTASTTEANATMKANNIAITSGEASEEINLNVGNNTITIEVTAQDNTTTKSYTLNINRAKKSKSSNSSQANCDAEAIVNGKTAEIGTVNTTHDGAQSVTTIILDNQKLEDILNDDVSNPTVTIPVSSKSDVVVGQLNGEIVKNMEQREAELEIKTETVIYRLPASQIDINGVSSQIGSKVDLKDIKVCVKIAEPSEDTVKVVEDSASKNGYQIVVKPVNFEITCTSGNKTVQVSKFNGYVERIVAIPDDIDPGKITTGIVLNEDGNFRHVPTQIVVIDGKYFAKINSLTNSTYSVIWNPVEFADVADHWAKLSINDMGSRMIVTGVGSGNYDPNRSITRAEFAAIVVRAMGLDEGATESSFNDVNSSDWYNGYVDTATTYELITGYNSIAYGPNDTITREQAMTIIARAMKTTGLNVSTTDEETIEILSNYTDGSLVSDYAKEWVVACLKSGVVTGTSDNTLSPKAYVTRAEVAVMVQRLLQQSELI